jgi:tRNA threonylcarbamoyl adenosine modification protein YeaZ
LDLIVDTSTERAVVLLAREGRVLRFSWLPYGLQNSRYLLPAIEELLAAEGSGLKELTQVAVGIGPGSYTGVRVGVAAIKALAYALNLPLLGFPSTTCWTPAQEGPFATVLDAKSGGVYLQTGVKELGGVRYTSAPQLASIEQAQALLQSLPCYVSPVCGRLETLFTALPGVWQESAPDPAHLAMQIEQNRAKSCTDGRLELLYLRCLQP